jgi:hypothetical protein
MQTKLVFSICAITASIMTVLVLIRDKSDIPFTPNTINNDGFFSYKKKTYTNYQTKGDTITFLTDLNTCSILISGCETGTITPFVNGMTSDLIQSMVSVYSSRPFTHRIELTGVTKGDTMRLKFTYRGIFDASKIRITILQ